MNWLIFASIALGVIALLVIAWQLDNIEDTIAAHRDLLRRNRWRDGRNQ